MVIVYVVFKKMYVLIWHMLGFSCVKNFHNFDAIRFFRDERFGGCTLGTSPKPFGDEKIEVRQIWKFLNLADAGDAGKFLGPLRFVDLLVRDNLRKVYPLPALHQLSVVRFGSGLVGGELVHKVVAREE